MKLLLPIVALLAATIIQEVTSEEHALFIRNEVLRKGKSRVTRQTNADQMVQNILQWLQGVYTQNSRRIRQGTLREYLPPSNTQKPRPFEPVGTTVNGYPPAGITPQPPFPYPTIPGVNGYPQTNIPTERPGFPTGPPTDRPGYPTGPPTGYQPGFSTAPPTGYQPGTTLLPQDRPGFPTAPPPGYQPGSTLPPQDRPGFPTAPPPGYQPGSTLPPQDRPGFPTAPPTERPGFPTSPPTGYPSAGGPTDKPSFPTPIPTGYPSTELPSVTTGGYSYPTGQPAFTTGATAPSQEFTTIGGGGSTTSSSEYTTLAPQGFTTAKSEGSTGYPTPGSPSTSFPVTTEHAVEVTTGNIQPEVTPGFPTHAPVEDLSTSPPAEGSSTHQAVTTPQEFTSAPETTQSPSAPSVPLTTESAEVNTIPTGKTPDTGDNTGTGTDVDEDLKHPPHIHDIQVDCGKEMMTINIEFNRQFDGIIYSKGFYNNPECRYVNENSGQTKYSFTVNLNTCGTEFVNAFDTEGKSYLQNVLVIQNEAGIQEVWDVIRSVRCLWEGSLKDTLSVALSVGMLTQEIITFSGDTAMAKLDIQLGKGPFAPAADGLVKIGETLTLVVSVSGDPGFDLQVKDCRATDSTNENVVPLTDENGCVLKPKLFGAFQKTRNTGDTGASIIAYAFFSAFKFPDVMDLMIECNIELCKTDCEVCPDPNQKIDPGRRKRDLSYYNQTLQDGITMGKHLRVLLPEDLSDAKAIINLSQDDGVCMSTQSFVFSSALLISLLISSCFFSAFLWLQNQRLSLKN